MFYLLTYLLTYLLPVIWWPWWHAYDQCHL